MAPVAPDPNCLLMKHIAMQCFSASRMLPRAGSSSSGAIRGISVRIPVGLPTILKHQRPRQHYDTSDEQ